MPVNGELKCKAITGLYTYVKIGTPGTIAVMFCPNSNI